MTRIPFIIETKEDLAGAASTLCARDPRLAEMASRLRQAGVEVPLRRVEPGFAALLRLIVAQQVSLRSAAAIWARTEAAGLTRASACLEGGPQALAEAGFSRAKGRYAIELARAELSGRLDLGALLRQDDTEAVETLRQILGIGRWTAQVYLLSALGRADVWPAGDLALRTAAAGAFGLNRRPNEREMTALAEPWRPLRSVAARLLWAVYSLP